ncbi:MAG TPA: acyltransferase domain-containing protein, partial [Steroidobacteraceae bacterium]|nr:acyltransferase domain-containing protein [Steroidobacteraceae bacterium]
DAHAILGRDVRQWVLAATPAQLYANASAQLLCCLQALAAWRALDLQQALPGEEIVLAGYSVGELASWGCAGLIAPADVLRLAIVRAEAMDRAAGSDTGMASVRGLARASMERLCRAHGCEIAIALSEDSVVVGGRREALASLVREALASGARRSTALPITVAAHTSLLAAASTELRARLCEVPLAGGLLAGVRLLSGIDGDTVLDRAAGLDRLAQQLSHTLDWHACLTACREAGVTRVLELGPGKALANMAREALPQARCRALEEFRSLDGVHTWLRADRQE